MTGKAELLPENFGELIEHAGSHTVHGRVALTIQFRYKRLLWL
jgi:hypothetical protein